MSNFIFSTTMGWSQIFLTFLFLTQVFLVTNEADFRRPVWNIAHMVNALYQIDHYLDKGANGIEFDVSFSTEGVAQFTFHGFPCDCFRNCVQYEDFTSFLQYLRQLTTPGESIFRKELVLLLMDFKVGGLTSQGLKNAGEDVAMKLLDHYWMRGKSETEAYIIISLPSAKHIEVMESLQRTLHYQNASEYISKIGLDFSGNEDLHAIKNSLENSGIVENYWLGDGITNCLGRSTKRLTAALNKRDIHDEQISKVYWWTVDRKTTMRRVISLGVDAVITNYPESLLKVLKEDAFSRHVRLATFEDNPWKKYNLSTKKLNSFQNVNSAFFDRSEVEEYLYN